MKICLLTRSHYLLDPRLHSRIGLSLVKGGHRIHVICRQFPKKPASSQSREGIHYYTIPRPAKPKRDFANMFRILIRAFKIRADVYVCFELRTMAMGLLFKLFWGSRVIYDCHEYRAESYSEILPSAFGGIFVESYRMLEKFLAHRCDHIWCVNRHLALRLDSNGRQSTILPNYPSKIQFETVKDLPKDISARYDQRKLLIYSGGITKARGVNACLHVLAYLRTLVDDVFLLLLGGVEDSYRIKLNSIIKRLNLNEVVEFAGRVPYHEVPGYLAIGNLGLYLAQSGNMRYQWGEPIKYFEYSAAGLPVAFSDLPAKRRLIERIGNGILVDPSNPSKTAHKIAALLRDDKKLDMMAEKGRRAFLNEFNWEKVAPDMLATIDKLILT